MRLGHDAEFSAWLPNIGRDIVFAMMAVGSLSFSFGCFLSPTKGCRMLSACAAASRPGSWAFQSCATCTAPPQPCRILRTSFGAMQDLMLMYSSKSMSVVLQNVVRILVDRLAYVWPMHVMHVMCVMPQVRRRAGACS